MTRTVIYPSSRHVRISDRWQAPALTHDGSFLRALTLRTRFFSDNPCGRFSSSATLCANRTGSSCTHTALPYRRQARALLDGSNCLRGHI